MVLFCCVVFALNMNYSQVLSGQLLMTVCESIMIGFFSFAYGMWFVFPYIWIKGKDGKMAQDLIESIYWMPCNVEAFFDVIFNPYKTKFLTELSGSRFVNCNITLTRRNTIANEMICFAYNLAYQITGYLRALVNKK